MENDPPAPPLTHHEQMHASQLPLELGTHFSSAAAKALGVSAMRLRAKDLEAPFRGTRVRAWRGEVGADRYALACRRELSLVRALGTRLVASQFISHRSAALLWGAPLPHLDRADLHVSTIAPARAPRIQNVTGHSFPQHRVKLGCVEGIAVAAPASVFVSMGSLPLADLVALGDYFVRKHRPGHGRPNAGRASLATVAELAEMVDLGRWLGAPRLRQALSLVREDSWSPRESSTRLVLVLAGLPEPDLNIDVFDRSGYFLGCIDIAYSKYKVAVEYQGQQHAATYAADIERIERLRAEGWEVIQVTAALAARPRALVDRVANALHRRGWSGL